MTQLTAQGKSRRVLDAMREMHLMYSNFENWKILDNHSLGKSVDQA